MAAMTGDGYAGDGSPDRVDALVWALSELMTRASPGRVVFGRYGQVPDAVYYSSQTRESLFPEGEEIKPSHMVGWN